MKTRNLGFCGALIGGLGLLMTGSAAAAETTAQTAAISPRWRTRALPCLKQLRRNHADTDAETVSVVIGKKTDPATADPRSAIDELRSCAPGIETPAVNFNAVILTPPAATDGIDAADLSKLAQSPAPRPDPVTASASAPAAKSDLFRAQQAELDRLKQRLRELQEKLEQERQALAAELAQARQNLAASAAAATELRKRLATLEKQADDERQQADQAIAELQKKNFELSRTAEELAAEIQAERDQTAASRQQAAVTAEQLTQAQARIDRLQRERNQAVAEAAIATRNLEEVRRERDELLAKVEQLTQGLNPEIARLHYNLGVLLQQAKRYADAEREYRQAVVGNPAAADPHYNLAVLYDDYLNRDRDAVEHYEKYLELNPACPDRAEVETWIVRAKTAARTEPPRK